MGVAYTHGIGTQYQDPCLLGGLNQFCFQILAVRSGFPKPGGDQEHILNAFFPEFRYEIQDPGGRYGYRRQADLFRYLGNGSKNFSARDGAAFRVDRVN